jgi:hypothetical protein
MKNKIDCEYLPPLPLRFCFHLWLLNIFSGTITSRKRQSSEVLGSGVGRSERLKELDEELDSLIKVATGTPDKNCASINSHAGFA